MSADASTANADAPLAVRLAAIPRWVDGVFVALAAWIAHGWTVVTGGLVFDDTMILDSPVLREKRFSALFTGEYFSLGTGEASWRPTTTLSHMVDVALSRPDQGSPSTFIWHHFVNVGLHAVAVLLLWRVALCWGWSRVGALVAALLFAVHPLASEAVGIVSFREEILVAVLCGAAILLSWPRPAGPGRLVGAGLCAFLACGAKEAALVLPVLLAAAAWVLPLDAGDDRRARWVRWVAPAAIGTLLFVPLRFLVYVPEAGMMGYVGHPGGSFVQTGLTMSWISARYLGLFVWPDPLCIDHVQQDALTFFDGRSAVGLCAVAAVLAVGAWSWLRAPRAFVAWCWAVLFVAPVLDIVPIANIMAERYCYLPLAGAALFVGTGAGWWARRAATGRAGGPAVLAVVMLVVAGAGTVRTAARAPEFENDVELWFAGAAACPGSWRAALMMGFLLRTTQPTQGAMNEYFRRLDAVESALGGPFIPDDRDYVSKRDGLRAVVARLRDGNRDDLFDLDVASNELEILFRRRSVATAQAWSPEEPQTWFDLGVALREGAEIRLNQVRPLEGRISYLAGELRKRDAAGHETAPIHRAISRLAEQAHRLRPEAHERLAQAEEWLLAATRGARMSRTSRARAFENLSGASGLRDPTQVKVREYAEKAIALNPTQAFALYNLGVYFMSKAEREPHDTDQKVADGKTAIAWFERAMEQPETARPAFFNWYALKKRVGPLPPGSPGERAIFDRWEALCDRLPEDLPMRKALARALAPAHQYDAAERNLEYVLIRDPQWAEGWFLWAEVAGDSRADDDPGDPERAHAILTRGLGFCGAELRKTFGAEARLASYVARTRGPKLYKEKLSRPDDFALFRDIGLNAMKIPDLHVALEHLTRARAINATRFASEGHEPLLARLDKQLSEGRRDDELRRNGSIPSLIFRAEEVFREGNLESARLWLKSARERDEAAYEKDRRAAPLLGRVMAGIDLVRFGSIDEIVAHARRAAEAHRWPEAAFYWRTARTRAPDAFRAAGGAAALEEAERELLKRR